MRRQNRALKALRDGAHGPLASVVMAAGACCTATQAQTSLPPPAARANVSAAGQAMPAAQPTQDGRALEFDPDILRSLGLSPAIAAYFRQGARFRPGVQWVVFTINGNELGRRSVTFDTTGRLCFTPALTASLGVRDLERSARGGVGASADEACPDYRVQAPRMLVVLRPSEAAVELTVPPQDLVAVSNLQRVEVGGVGAMLNYRGYAYESRVPGGALNATRYLDTELGFNAGDWIVRSHQMYSQSDGVGRYRWQSAYAQKTFADQKQVLQVGRITTRAALYAGLPITGAQWFPEHGLRQRRNFPVTGVAATRSRVEIRQNGMLLYSTVVPPGPFALTDYPLTDTASDLRVSIFEETGGEQVIVVPASSLLLASDNTQNEGLSIAAGRLWSSADVRNYDDVPMVMGAYGWARGGVSGTVGGLMSSHYASSGVAANWRFTPTANAFAQVVAARDAGRGVQGALGSTALAWAIDDVLSVGVSGNLRSLGYRTLQEAASVVEIPASGLGARSQVGTTASLNLGRWGALSAGVTRTTYFDEKSGNVYTLAWGAAWRQISLQVGVSRNTTRADSLDTEVSPLIRRSPTYAYVTLSIALGSGVTGTAYSRNTGDVTYQGVGINQRVDDMLTYHLSTERASDRPGVENSASVNVMPRYAAVSLGLSDRQGRGRSIYGEITGSVLATPMGVGFSPYPVQDTFGTIRTGDVVGLKVNTPLGPVWSGPGGIAAVPSLPAYRSSTLEANLTSAALDVDVGNPSQVVQAGRGAVLGVDMDARHVRRLLLTVTDAKNVPLPAGLPVLRGGDEFISSTIRGGRVMVERMVDDAALHVELPDGRRCLIQDIRTRTRADGEFFESATAVCK